MPAQAEAKPMHTPARSYAIDPRGVIRTITAIEEKSEATYLTKSCGHRTPYAQHFAYKVGAEVRCFTCGEEARAAIARAPEPK